MAQLIVSVAGAAIGFAIGGPTGAQIGWTLGSAVGSQFGPTQRAYGPKLTDLKITGTAYGDTIPWIAGHPRNAGQIWWASDRREIATTEDVGKGGPSASYTSYTYELDLLIGLTDCQIGAVTRIWHNGKLVWTNLAAADDPSRIASEGTDLWRRITIYTGASDQLPDPTYETAVGVGNAPAYRGRGAVFLEGLQLGGPPAILPNLTFEIAMDTAPADDIVLRWQNEAITEIVFKDQFFERAGPAVITQVEDEVRVGLVDDVDTTIYRFSLVGAYLGTDTRTVDDTFPGPTGGSSPVTSPCGMIGGDPLRICASNRGTLPASALILPIGTLNAGVGITGTDLADVLPANEYVGVISMGCNDSQHCVIYTAPVSPIPGASVIDKWYLVQWDGTTASIVRQGTLAANFSTASMYFSRTGDASVGACSALENDNLHVWICNAGSIDMYRLDDDNVMRLKGHLDSTNDGLTTAYAKSIHARDGYCVVVGGWNSTESRFESYRRAGETIVEATLQDTVDRLLALAQMPAGTTDTTALAAITKPVRALTVAQTSTVRSTLELLAAGYYFDTFATDKLYFVPRAAASAMTISAADMGCGIDEAAPDLLPMTVGNDGEIPAQIAISYLNVDADYNVATEQSDRGGDGQITTNPMQMALGFTSSEAKGIADAMALDGYASRISGSLTLPLVYAKLAPTDVVTVPDAAGNTYRVRLVQRKDSGALLEFAWVSDDATAVISAGTTSTDYTPSVTVSRPAATVMTLMDIPILRDADDAPGIYVAARGDGGTYPGSRILSSPDGVTYETEGDITASAVLGEVTAYLTDWTGGNVFDESGSVTVDVDIGTLSSSTRDALLDSDANAALVGNEIIQFRIATLVSAGIYKLTGLLRGRRGTEWAMTGHANGEDFVLLRTAGLLRAAMTAPDIGTQRYWKGVTLGRSVTSATPQLFTDTGRALLPLAPLNLRVDTSVDGLYTVTWSRRTRYAYRWPGTTDLPLGEASESYIARLYDGGSALIDTQTVSSASVTFSSAIRNLTLDEGIGCLQVISGSYYGIQLEGSGVRYLLAIDAAGTVTSTSFSLGDTAASMVTSGGNLFAIGHVLSSGTPRTYLASTIYKVAPAALTSVAASYTLPTAGDAQVLCHDGTYLWTVGYYSGNLIKLDGSTLALSSATAVEAGLWGIASDATWLYLANRDTGDVIGYDPAAGTPEQWRVTPGTSAVELLVTGGKLFVASTDRVDVLTASTGATLYTHTGPPTFGTGTVSLVLFGSYVVYRRATGGYVVFLNASTGDIAFESNLPAITYLTGANGTTLMTVGSPTLDFNNYETWGYSLNASLAGFSVTVAQISATVGAGRIATLTL